jgi:L-fucose isomerase-like protein
MENKQTFGVIVTSRGIFPAELAVKERQNIIEKLKKMGFGCVILSEDTVPNGAVETYQDVKKCAQLFKENRDNIDGIIVILPNFGDEQAVVQSIDMSELNILFTNTTFHTCSIESEIFTKDIERFAGICRVIKGLRKARVGAIGARPEAFHTVRFSEKLLQAYGIKVVTVDLSEIFSITEKLDSNAKQIKEKIEAIKEYGQIPPDIPKANIIKQAKLSVTIDNWMEENELVASAIQCWNSVQQNYGCATCLSMSMMGEKGKPSACEMDIAGTISMYALNLASDGNPSGFVDWNNNYLNQQDKCVVTHCSNYPKSFMGNDIEISNLDVLGAALGPDNCFGGIKGRIAPGEFTYARISTDDTRGLIKAYVGQGCFTNDPLECDGGIGVCEIPRFQDLLDYLCQNGFEHHVAMNRSLCMDIVAEAFDKYLGWEVYCHE